jgi:hypothetical protein
MTKETKMQMINDVLSKLEELKSSYNFIMVENSFITTAITSMNILSKLEESDFDWNKIDNE